MHFKATALLAPQEAAEAYAVGLFEDVKGDNPAKGYSTGMKGDMVK